jgi:hypothetical protein
MKAPPGLRRVTSVLVASGPVRNLSDVRTGRRGILDPEDSGVKKTPEVPPEQPPGNPRAPVPLIQLESPSQNPLDRSHR